MAINQDIINPNTNWENQTKGYVEDGLKALLRAMLDVLENPTVASNSVGREQLTQAIRDAIDSIAGKVPNNRTVNNKALSQNITLNSSDVGAMPADAPVVKGVAVGENNPVTPDSNGIVTLPDGGSPQVPDAAMNDTSENAVQNKVIKAYVDNLINGLINGAPAALDTLKELADALGNNGDAIATLTNAIAGKVDKETGKGLSTNDYTNADKTKLAGISAGAEVNVIDGIIVGNTEVQPVNKKVTIPAGADGITPHIGSNGHWWLGDENDSENDTGVTAQGPAGTSYTSADLAIGNALNGQGDVLGMAGAMQMKANIDSLFTSLSRLYSKLGNMAFWNAADKAAAAPTALDWQVPQVTVTLDKTGLSANAMITNANDQEITGTSVSVDQGSGLTLKIKPRPGYAITAASATIGGVSQTLTESNGIYTLAIASVTSAITIVFNVTADELPDTFSISYQLTNCAQATGETNPTQVTEGQGETIKLECSSGYELTLADITVRGATKGTLTESNGVYTLTITNATDNVIVTAAASVVTMKFLHHYFIHPNDGRIYYNFGGETSTYTADRVILSEYVKLPSYDGALKDTVVTYNQLRGNVEPWPSSLIFYKYENGAFTQILTFGWNNNSGARTVTRANILSNEYITDRQQKVADIEAALASGTCYIRFCLYLNAAKDGLQPNTSTGNDSAGVTYNGSVIFNKNTPYTVLEAADWTVDDLSEVVTS